MSTPVDGAGSVPTRPRTNPPLPWAALCRIVGAPDQTDVESDGIAGITGLSLNTARVRPGDLYLALPGARVHGADFTEQAVAAGAVAVLTDPAGAERIGVAGLPVLTVPEPRTLLGSLSAAVYGHPADRLRTVAVTGTQGKTTTTRLLEGAWQRTGVHGAVIGTVGTRIDGADVPTSLTTPEAPDLHGLFARMVEDGVEACAMEVSSHALVMGRVDGVVFDVAVFTNLGRDHLDFHADLEEYFEVKASLFTPERARRGLVNLDDPYGREIRDRALIETRTFSLADPSADWYARDLVSDAEGSRFTLVGPDVAVPCTVPLPGDFNVANAVAALAAAAEAGYDVVALAAAVETGGGVPGRLERVETDGDFSVIVDYAHKPDALEATLATLRPLARGRVILVIGAGGDRDRGKRPLMGEIAARAADLVVVADDNPRSEDPAAIRAEVIAGVDPAYRDRVVELGDRRAAIAHAIAQAGPGDIVLIAGKGHESGQEVAGVVHAFDDREVAAQELGRR